LSRYGSFSSEEEEDADADADADAEEERKTTGPGVLKGSTEEVARKHGR